jgi:aspartyl/asparaginyl beta-hydroxylase (cupin superfamily)
MQPPKSQPVAAARVEQMVQAAIAARQAGDRARELALLEQALAEAPHHPLANNARGLRALADQDFAAAERAFATAAEADPGQPPLLMNLAVARRGKGDRDGEREALQAVLDVDQRHLMAQLRMAEWHEAGGNVAAAAEYWRHVLVLAPEPEALSDAMNARLAHGRALVERQDSDFAARIDAGLAPARAALPEAATRRFDACVDVMVGRRRIFQNHCSGMHYPFLPADEFFERRHFPWMPAAEAKTAAIRAELEALVQRAPEAIRPYVRQEKGTPPNRWSELDHKLDWGAIFLWEYGAPNQPVLDHCPETAAMLAGLPRNHIPGRAPSAFFSLLKPRTRIPPHTGVTNTRAIVHLPLIVPEGCGFRVGGETRPWKVGEAFAFDDTIEHEAWNDSDELRVVLIFDVWNPHLSEAEQQLLVQFFAAADASGHNPGFPTSQ